MAVIFNYRFSSGALSGDWGLKIEIYSSLYREQRGIKSIWKSYRKKWKLKKSKREKEKDLKRTSKREREREHETELILGKLGRKK